MFDIFKKKKSRVASSVRAWAKTQSQLNQKNQSVAITLSNSIIYGLSSFCSSPQ